MATSRKCGRGARERPAVVRRLGWTRCEARCSTRSNGGDAEVCSSLAGWAWTTNDLLDFDASTLEFGEAGDARMLLREHGDVFRAQLVAARWLDGYRHRRFTSQQTRPGGWPDAHQAGWDDAMKDVVEHLRQGDFLPGGRLYDDEAKGRFRG